MMMIGNNEVYAVETGGMIDTAIRAVDLATFEQVLISNGLMFPESEYPRTMGHLKAVAGVDISHIGSVEVTPAEMDGETVVAPAVVDTRHHANMRLSGRALEVTLPDGMLKWQAILLSWMAYGQVDTEINADERGKVLHGISLLDTTRFSSPVNGWA